MHTVLVPGTRYVRGAKTSALSAKVERSYVSRATALLLHCRVLLYHPDSTRNTTVSVPKLSVLSTPSNLATQNGDGWTTIIGKQKKNGSKGLD